MSYQAALISVVTLLIIIISAIILFGSTVPRDLTSNAEGHHDVSPEAIELSTELASALPDSVFLPRHATIFEKSMRAYWAQQEYKVTPCCVVRPRDATELSVAVKILNKTFQGRRTHTAEGMFAVRGGGHSPVPNAASIKGGVMIDLSLLCDVVVSEDRSNVTIGGGAKWIDVSRTLDRMGLAVVGGRNSAVGVGGLTLGGGISFFSSRYGLVCSNIMRYELVLASGSIVTASATQNADLWRALKGGSNNFGIVTRFTARSFPTNKIWSGFIYMPSFQAVKVLAAFHDFVSRADPSNIDTKYDNYAAGPIACFSYIQAVRIQIVSVNLVYTKPPENEKQWPPCWQTSQFSSLWRLWSTCEVRALTSATDEMNTLNPPGRRQVFATTTIKNDPATLTAMHTFYQDAIAPLRRERIQGLVWTLVLQPFLPDWVRKGDPNPLGLHDCGDEPLVMVSFTVNWDRERNDQFVKTTLRQVIEQMEDYARANNTDHPYRYLNYCAQWQEPFASYGQENWLFLKQVSRKYDPDGLFQKGCVGGFKLEVHDSDGRAELN